MSEDQELEALLNSGKAAELAAGLDVIARVLGTFYFSLQSQGLPDPLIHSLVVEMYRHMLAATKGKGA